MPPFENILLSSSRVKSYHLFQIPQEVYVKKITTNWTDKQTRRQKGLQR